MSIVNRVAESGLIQFDPAILVKDISVSAVSISDFLNEEPILRENPSVKRLLPMTGPPILVSMWLYKSTKRHWCYSGRNAADKLLATLCVGVCLGDQSSLLWIWLMSLLCQSSKLRITIKKISLSKGVAMGRYPTGSMFG